MSDSEETTDQKIDRLLDEFSKIKHLVHMDLRVKNGNTIEFVISEVRKRRRSGLSVMDMKRLTNFSRPWCLELMERIPLTNPQIKYIRGDRHSQRGGRLIWLEEADQKNFDKIKELVEKEGIVPYSRLMTAFSVQKTVARDMAMAFCEANPEYITYLDESRNNGRWSFEECNIIRKKTVNNDINTE